MRGTVIGLDRDVLQNQTDALAQRSAVGPVSGIVPEHLDRSAVTGSESLEDLHDGGFAGSVGPNSANISPCSTVKLTPRTALLRRDSLC